MRHVVEIARTGLTAVLLHPLRSAVTVICVVAVLLPYLTALGISRGLQEQAGVAINLGADLYVTGRQLGRDVPIPVASAQEIRRLDGVTEVVPRIVAGIVLGRNHESAVLVGMPSDKFPTGVTCVEGSLPVEGSLHELVVGTELARRLNLEVGTTLPPFYHNDRGERLEKIVGIFKSDVSLWQARLLFTTLNSASVILNQEGLATDFLVYCRPGYQDQVRKQILQGVRFPSGNSGGSATPAVTLREDLDALLPRGLLRREGAFHLLFVCAFSVAILVTLVTSGLGLSERRHEIGILKATGWQTDEILLRATVESFLLSLLGASVSILLAFLWLRGLNGYGIAGVFLAGVEAVPSFSVPFRLTPVPALLAFVLAFVVVMMGSLYSTWRAATVAPLDAMR